MDERRYVCPDPLARRLDQLLDDRLLADVLPERDGNAVLTTLAPAHSATPYCDDVRVAEADVIGRWAPGGLADAVRPWLQARPAGSLRTPTQVVRHTDGRVVAAAIVLPLAGAAALARTGEDRAELVGPLLDHAARHDMTDRVVISPFQLLAPCAGEEHLNTARELVAVAADRAGAPL